MLNLYETAIFYAYESFLHMNMGHLPRLDQNMLLHQIKKFDHLHGRSLICYLTSVFA